MGAKENNVDYSLERANFGEGLGGNCVKEKEKRRKVECVCVCMCGCGARVYTRYCCCFFNTLIVKFGMEQV
jgi:hypothetical protein